MPASGANIKVLVALNQAFNDHVRDEERRFEDIAKKLDGLAGIPVTLVDIRSSLNANSASLQSFAERTREQNGRVGKLERWKSWATGALFVGGAVGGYILRQVLSSGWPK